MTPRFLPEHVLGLLTEIDGEFHDVLDAHIKAAVQTPDTAVVELAGVVTNGSPLAPEFFAVTVKRIPMESL